MKYDQVQELVTQIRRGVGLKGCKKCGKVLPEGLFLKGTPTLSSMTRGGASLEELEKAMKERGWYCRGCVNKIRQGDTAAGVDVTTSTTTSTTREQFATEQEYLDFLYARDFPNGT